jgi:uncharacterized protein YdaU (DUF1376 family)
MARPWYSFYPADYGRDTGHLTLVEHGAYRVLMDHYYSQEAPLPANVTRLFRLCRAKTAEEKKAVRFVLKEFFDGSEDGYRHKRIDAEIAKAEMASARGTMAARVGAAKRQRISGETPAQVQPSPSQPQSPSESLFEEFWAAYPKKEARGAALKAWCLAVQIAKPESLVAAAKAYAARRDGQPAQYTRLPATWLAQQCWLDDAPAVVDDSEAARAWDGKAAPLVAEIGAALFTAYFAGTEFAPGPPVLIRVAKPHLRALIARRFSGALKRCYGEFNLEGLSE